MTAATPLTQIRCFLLDMDGTFYLGEKLFPGSLPFIDVLNRRGVDFRFLTNNSSRDAARYAEKITRLGLPIPPEKVFTSGEATAIHLQQQHPGAHLYVVGTPALESEFTRRGFILDSASPQIAVLGFDTGVTYEKLRRLCDLVRAGLPYIATHPDINCPTEDGFMPDTGAMIALVKASAGRDPDLIVGKPNRMIAEAAARKLGLPMSALCMVGDRLYTDIALGKNAGITTILVLSGETRREDLEGSPHQPDYIFDEIGDVGRALENS